MGWLKTDVVFPDRRAILSISTMRVSSLLQRLREFDNTRDVLALEAFLRAIIIENLPDLENCSILWMDYNATIGGFDVLVEHPSIDPVALGAEIKKQTLIIG